MYNLTKIFFFLALLKTYRFWFRVAEVWVWAATLTLTLTVMSYSLWKKDIGRWMERFVLCCIKLNVCSLWENKNKDSLWIRGFHIFCRYQSFFFIYNFSFHKLFQFVFIFVDWYMWNLWFVVLNTSGHQITVAGYIFTVGHRDRVLEFWTQTQVLTQDKVTWAADW